VSTKEWTTRALVACVDGPMQGQWYFLTDWDERVESAKYMAVRGQRRSVCLDYEAAGAPIPHPDEPLAMGTPLTYRGPR
jgi:hypothetical protein